MPYLHAIQTSYFSDSSFFAININNLFHLTLELYLVFLLTPSLFCNYASHCSFLSGGRPTRSNFNELHRSQLTEKIQKKSCCLSISAMQKKEKSYLFLYACPLVARRRLWFLVTSSFLKTVLFTKILKYITFVYCSYTTIFWRLSQHTIASDCRQHLYLLNIK